MAEIALAEVERRQEEDRPQLTSKNGNIVKKTHHLEFLQSLERSSASTPVLIVSFLAQSFLLLRVNTMLHYMDA